jgi:hypothetical protein
LGILFSFSGFFFPSRFLASSLDIIFWALFIILLIFGSLFSSFGFFCLLIYFWFHKSHPNNMEQVFILLAISTSMFKILMKPFQQVCNFKYILT